MKIIVIFLIVSTISVLLWSCEGAIYSGSGKNYAAQILKDSEGKIGYGNSKPGHARKHILANVIQFSKEPAERQLEKSAFSDEDTQNDVANRILTHSITKFEMEALNCPHAYDIMKNNPSGTGVPEIYSKIAVYLTKDQLGYKKSTPPMVTVYKNGNLLRQNRPMVGATIVLQHKKGEQLNINSNVHVLTLYPKD